MPPRSPHTPSRQGLPRPHRDGDRGNATMRQDTAARDLVREKVRKLLTESEAFWSLSEARRKALARDMVSVAEFIVSGPAGDNVPKSAQLVGAPMATSLADQRPYDPAS